MKIAEFKDKAARLYYTHFSLVEKGYPVNDPERTKAQLLRLGIAVEPFFVRKSEYDDFFLKADLPDNIYPQVKKQKALEYFVSAELLAFNPADVYLDVASAQSIFPDLVRKFYNCKVYRQDLRYKQGVDNDRIGGDAACVPLPDGSLSKMALHCSFEHFQGNSDSLFIKEAARLLKKDGLLCILPVYFADKFTNLINPLTTNPKEIIRDEAALRMYQFDHKDPFSRFYTIEQFKNRVVDFSEGMALKFFYLENEKELDKTCYLKFIALFRKL